MEEPGRSPEWTAAIEAFAAVSKYVRNRFERSLLFQALKALGSLDTAAVLITGEGRIQRTPQSLRILSDDVGEYPGGEEIASGDVGKFWFVVGYSEVGGPDLVRPEGEPS